MVWEFFRIISKYTNITWAWSVEMTETWLQALSFYLGYFKFGDFFLLKSESQAIHNREEKKMAARWIYKQATNL